jgi:hypothetical protein
MCAAIDEAGLDRGPWVIASRIRFSKNPAAFLLSRTSAQQIDWKQSNQIPDPYFISLAGLRRHALAYFPPSIAEYVHLLRVA